MGSSEKKKAIFTGVIALCIALFLPTHGFALDVFFNGVKVSGLSNQAFKNCEVKFDKDGNVHITAKGYSVRKVGDNKKPVPPLGTSPEEAMPSAPKLKQQYFLVSLGKNRKHVQYDVDVFINGKWVRKVSSFEKQYIGDISKYLKKGKNQIQFAASKNYKGQKRISQKKEDYMKLIIGSGDDIGETVSITRTHVEFSISAAKSENFGKTYHFKAQ